MDKHSRNFLIHQPTIFLIFEIAVKITENPIMSQRNDPQVLGVLYPPGAEKIISMMLWIWGFNRATFWGLL
jgi:hypothetical protein